MFVVRRLCSLCYWTLRFQLKVSCKSNLVYLYDDHIEVTVYDTEKKEYSRSLIGRE